MDKLLLKGGRVIDPASGLNDVRDVLVGDGKILAIDAGIAADGAQVVDCAGRLVLPA
jgi:dihydroorotase